MGKSEETSPMSDDHVQLPIKIDATSNGEFLPMPIGRTVAQAKALAAARITDNARRLNLSRRTFLTSLSGVATTLLTLNHAFAARSNTGGYFQVAPEAAYDLAAAQESLSGSEFIFDIQTHMVDPQGDWRRGSGKLFERFLAWVPQGTCGEADPTDCFSAQRFIKEIFLDSDTSMAVLSFVPAPPRHNPLSLTEAARTRTLVEALGGGKRLLLHAMVLPNLPPYEAQLEAMAQAVEEWQIAAWKVYTQWGPSGVGWALDDPQVGLPFLDKARALGVRNICIHKGFPLQRHSPQFADCADVGRVAKLFPDLNFIIYHSGFESRHREGPYDPSLAARGVDSLVKALQDNGIGPHANVYAELGSTWRAVMRDPTAAAHTLGKLLRYVGEERVLWGTDSIWYGSPQDQIQAFRTFQIAEELQERHQYPALTAALKTKVFGLNAAVVYGVDPVRMHRKTQQDQLEHVRAAYQTAPVPSLATYGPKTSEEFWALQRQRQGLPA